MPFYNASQRGRIADTVLGMRVDRAASTMTNGLDLFTVTGGNVLVTLIVGEVVTLMDTEATNFHLQSNPTVGTTNAMSADLDLTAAEIGALLTIDGTAATATQKGSSGAVRGQATPVVVAPGAIEAYMDNDANTGTIKWSVWYVPLETGAYVTAA